MMNYSRKYVRVKKPQAASTPVTLMTSDSVPVSSLLAREIVKAEPLPEVTIDEDYTAKTFLHSTNDGNQIGLNPNMCGGLMPYRSYVDKVDCLGKHFSSTTIVNGPALSQFDETCTDESVLVLPLDTVETVSVDALMPGDDRIQTIHVGDFGEMSDYRYHGLGLHEADTFVASTDSSGTCYVTVQRERPKKDQKSTTVVKNLHSIKHSTPGGKRGLLRLGRSRMIADTHTSIAVAEFKSQLNDTSDIIGKLDIAPSTKRLMFLLNTKGVNKLFANPGRKMGSQVTKTFLRHLTLRQMPVDTTYDDMPLQPVGYVPQVDPSKIKRITRKRRYPEAEEYQRKLFHSQMQLAYFNSNIDMEVNESDTVFIHEEVILPDSQDSLLDPIDIEDEMRDCGNVIYTQGTDEIIADEEDGLLERIEDEARELEYQASENKHSILLAGEEETIEGSSSTCHNLEVLLAAEEKMSQGNYSQVNICKSEGDEETNEYLPGNGQIIIMPNDPLCETITETVLTSSGYYSENTEM